MNNTQKMWKRVLAMLLAVAMTITIVPCNWVYAAEPSTVQTSETDVVVLDKDNTKDISIVAVYGDEQPDPQQVADYTVSWLSQDTTIADVTADQADANKAVISAIGHGRTIIEVVATYEKEDGTTAESKGEIVVEVWETPTVEIISTSADNPATYPAKAAFAVNTDSQGQLTMTIDDGENIEEYIEGTEKDFAAGTYTITAKVAEDAANYYYPSLAKELEFVVNKADLKADITMKEAFYWDEEIEFTLPNQEIAGGYTVEAANLTVLDKNEVEIDSTTVLQPNTVVKLKANVDVDETGAKTKLVIRYTPSSEEGNYNTLEDNYTFVVNKASVNAEITTMKESLYWKEEYEFTLPDQEIEGRYSVTAANLSVVDESGTSVDSSTVLQPNAVVKIKANQLVDIEGTNTKLTVVFEPSESDKYNGLTKEYSLKVVKVPVTASWADGIFNRNYDGTTIVSTETAPSLEFAGNGNYDIPPDLMVTNTEFVFTLNSKDVGVRTAELNEALVLNDEHFELMNLKPSVNVEIGRIELTTDNVSTERDAGKAFDGTSTAVITAELNDTVPLIAAEELADGVITFSYEADYWDGSKVVIGDPSNNVTANSIRLSDLRILEGTEESKNYYFADNTTMIVDGSYDITCNGTFLEFMEVESLGNVTVENWEEKGEIEIHWFKEATKFDKDGISFATEPTARFWIDEFDEISDEPVAVYAKKESGEVSQPIYVAADVTKPVGGIYAQVGDKEAVTITQLLDEYYNLSKDQNITITFQGTDVDSKIAKIEWYGSDTALVEGWEEKKEEYTLTEAEEAALKVEWDKIESDKIIVIPVNEGADKTVNIPAFTLMNIGSDKALRKFYYAKVTDYAGNISYVTSSGVLQDISIPTVAIQLEDAEAVFGNKNEEVYAEDIAFKLDIKDPGITSGVTDVEVILKNYNGDILATHTAKEGKIWTSPTEIEAINTLKETVNPTDKQIDATNNIVVSGVFEGLDDGNYTMTVLVKDKVGNDNSAVLAEESFIKDSKKPEITFSNQLKFNDEPEEENLYTGGNWIVTVSDMTLETPVEKLMEGMGDVAADWKESQDSETGCITQTIILEFGSDKKFVEGNYKFDISASDSFDRTSKESSGDFVIDYTVPTYAVKFSSVDSLSYKKDRGTLYYNEAISATFEIDETTTYEDGVISIIVRNSATEEVIKWADGKQYVKNDNYVLEHEEDTNIFTLTILDVPENNDDGYKFSIEGKDKAGNRLVAAKAPADQMVDYEAEMKKTRVLDVTEPVVKSIAYSTKDAFNYVKENGRDYVNAPTKMTFTIAEHNPRDNESSVTSDGAPKSSQWKLNKTDVYTTELNVPMYGDYGDEQTVTLEIIDKAGNKAILDKDSKGEQIALRSKKNTTFENGKFTDKFTVDTVVPEIRLEYMKYTPDRENVVGIDYFRQEISVKVTVKEHNFEEALFSQPVKKTEDTVAYKETAWKTDGDTHVKIFTFEKDNQYDLSIIGTDNAKNKLKLQPTDKMAEIQSEKDGSVSLKVAVDHKIPAIGDKSKPVIVINPVKEKGKTENGQPLYNTDVTYEVVVYDPMLNKFASGIDNISISAEGEDGTKATCTVDKVGKITNGTGLSITRKSGDVSRLAKGVDDRYTFHVTLKSDEFNTNNVALTVNAEDVATNPNSVTTPKIGIDKTAPKVTVSYDNNDVSNEKYFHEVRTATIKVVERNFDDACLQFMVNGSDKHLNFKKSSDGDGNKDNTEWTATYTFSADNDYKVDVTCEDLAGNKGDVDYQGEAPQEFTIDMTKPTIEIEFDNNNALNENYYDAQRVATITIVERNFDAEDVEIIGEATDAGAAVAYPSISSWSSSEDINRATITYSADALYTLDVDYIDLATNEADDIEEERFTVDNTDPELTITGVENETPYAGEVLPKIDFSDNNYDRYEVKFTRTERENIGTDVRDEFIGEIGVSIDGTGKGVGSKQIEDLEYIEDNDGIYTLSVTVFDKAGRSMEETVVYSVNRFGSVYVYSDDLADMVKGYHKKVVGDLHIKAYNADRLIEDSTKLEISCDGSALSAQKSDADVVEAMVPNDGGWFEYKFDLAHEDFAADGRYSITISDMDEAGNTKTNSEQPIEFYVDATKPVLDSIIGLEEERVRTNEHEVQYAVSDAIALDSVQVYVNEKLVDEIKEFENITATNSTFKIGAGMNQKVRFVIKDKAGNVLDTDDAEFNPAYAFNSDITVSSNIFVLWYANKPLFWGTISATAAAVGGWLILLVMKKRKQQDAEE